MSEENTMTIADALTELKRIAKLLETRRENIHRFASKRKGADDEIEGQVAYVKEQKQSAEDLIQRWTTIKLLINQSNLETILHFKGKDFSVAEAILFKQQLYTYRKNLLDSFNLSVGREQVRAFINQQRIQTGMMTEENLEAINAVPVALYDEKAILKEREELLDLYSFVDALIEKSNHNTMITIP